MKNYKYHLVKFVEIFRVFLAICFFVFFGILAFIAHHLFLLILAIGVTATNGISMVLGRLGLFKQMKTIFPSAK